jgi:hypothetical protein
MELRYVSLPPNPTVAQVDAALAKLLAKRAATGFALVRGWIDAEVDTVLDLRSVAMLEAAVV